MNALAAAAFGMLLWNPAWIGDISFSLSFLAVAGILVWGVPLCRRLRGRNRVVRLVGEAYLIGLAATLATAPLVAHIFSLVPLVGVLVNPVAILLATVVVFGGRCGCSSRRRGWRPWWLFRSVPRPRGSTSWPAGWPRCPGVPSRRRSARGGRQPSMRPMCC